MIQKPSRCLLSLTSVSQPFHQKKAVAHRLLSSEFLTSTYLYSGGRIFSAESWSEGLR